MSQQLCISFDCEKVKVDHIEKETESCKTEYKLFSCVELKKLLVNTNNFLLNIDRDGCVYISINGTPLNGVKSLDLHIVAGEIPELSFKTMVV